MSSWILAAEWSAGCLPQRPHVVHNHIGSASCPRAAIGPAACGGIRHQCKDARSGARRSSALGSRRACAICVAAAVAPLRQVRSTAAPMAPRQHQVNAIAAHPAQPSGISAGDATRHHVGHGFLIPSTLRLRRQRSIHYRADDVSRQPGRTQQQHGGNNSGKLGSSHDPVTVGNLHDIARPAFDALSFCSPGVFLLHKV